MEKRGKGVKIEINNHTIAGFIGIALLIISVILWIVAWVIYGFPIFSWIDLIFLIVFTYVPYKTLIKKAKLTIGEWIIFIVVTIAWILIVFVSFIIGLIAGMTGMV